MTDTMRTDRRRLTAAVLAAAAFLTLPALPGSAQDAPKPDAPVEAKEPKTEPVTKGPFAVVLDLNGTFDAPNAADVMFDADVWGGDLEITELAAPGPVTQGQVLAKFKTDKFDEAFAAAERDLKLARFAFERQTDELKRQEELAALAMKKFETDASVAEIAFQRFVETDRELRLKEAATRIQQSKDNLADQEEELAQLEKMYKADELVEETEDIVLKRSRRQLERSRFWLSAQLVRDEWWRTQDFPREKDNLEAAKRRTAMELDRARFAAQTAAESQKIEYEKAKAGLAKLEENFTKLQHDKGQLVLTAPTAGIAVWGALARGKWGGLEMPTAVSIAAGRAKVKPNQVIWTVVRPGELIVRTSVGEGTVFSVAEGQTAKVKPGPAPKSSLAAKVTKVAKVSAGTDYEVLLDVTGADPRLMPGQTCKIQLTTVEKASALTVPAGAVESDGDKRYVHVVADGKPVRREVETGESSGGRTEIASGVNEGERVLATAPKAK